MKTEKYCSRCKQTLPLHDFGSNIAKADGLSNWCLACARAGRLQSKEKYAKTLRDKYANDPAFREKLLAHNKQWRDSSPSRQAAYRRFNKYGLTQECFDALFAKQDNKCAICHTDKPIGANWAVDHDHALTYVRGILCANCNAGLGFFGDDTNRMREAIAYLQNVRKRMQQQLIEEVGGHE